MWQAQYLVKFKCHILWQAQYLVKLKCRILWQAQYLVMAGAVLGETWKDSRSAKRCIFQYKMLVLSAKSNLVCAAGCGLTGSFSDHGRIILGLVSDRLRDGNDVSAVFRKFLLDFGWSFCVAGAVFG